MEVRLFFVGCGSVGGFSCFGWFILGFGFLVFVVFIVVVGCGGLGIRGLICNVSVLVV